MARKKAKRRRPTPKPAATRKRRTPAKKPRRRLNVPWPVVLWLLLGLNVAAGMAFSEVTSVRKVRVVGATEADQFRIRQHLENLRGIPWMRVDRWHLVWRLEQGQDVRSVEYRSNVFGRALLSVTAHQPVAVLEPGGRKQMTREGRIVSTSLPSEGLPTVVPPENALRPGALLLSSWEMEKVAELAEFAQEKLEKRAWSIELRRKGSLSLIGEGNRIVRFGTSADLSAKLAALEDVLRSGDAWGRYAIIDVSAPEDPVGIPR